MRKKENRNVTMKRLIPAVPVIAAIALIMSLAASDTAYAQATFGPQLDVTLDDSTPNAMSGYTLEFELPEGDVNFAGIVGFLPPDWGIVDGRDIPLGAVVGELTADAVLGLANSACNQELKVEFIMLNSSLDPDDSISFDVEDGADPFTEDWAEDLDGNGLLEHVDKWPEFIFRTLEDTTEQPIRRASGRAIVAGTPVLLQFLVFPQGTFINENIPNDVALGYPSVTLLQNAGDPEIVPEPGVITDFCSPLRSTNLSYGITEDNDETEADESGYPLFVNPQDGTHTFTVASVGQRDADGDGFENSLDTCPLVPDIGNPRVTNLGDADGDHLDAACDPDDSRVNSDEDLDGYLNGQDNCTLLANGEESTNQADEDEDQIGDICDPDPDCDDCQGDLILDSESFDITVGEGTGAGGAPDCPAVFAAASTVLSSDLPDGLNCVGAASDGTAEPTDGGPTPSDGEDDSGSDTGLIIAIIVGVIAAAVVVGGGAMLMMRRGGGAA